jgi:structure-specific recognition protein 1
MVDDVSFPSTSSSFEPSVLYLNLTIVPKSSALIAAALDNADLSSDEDVRADRGSADEDSESVDEDFHTDSDSDVAEEFDSAHESSGGESGSDAEMDDAAGDDDDDDAVLDEDEEEERPKKKSKVGK